MPRSQINPDLLVVGGGPAGLAAAIAATQAGLRVQLADAAHPPVDKACGEGLMPAALSALAELGVHLPPSETAPILGIRFKSRDHSAEARFPIGHGLGVRRTVLHRHLVSRAVELGIDLRWNTPLRHLADGVVELRGETLRPRWIVGADGSQSLVRSRAGLDLASPRSHRVGLRQHFRITPWSPFVEVHWTPHQGQAYVTPVAPDEVCVAFLSRTRHASFQRGLELFPELRDQLGSAQPTDAPRGGVTLCRTLPRVTSGNVALLGDASGSVDAITGEGLALSFRQSLALADTIRTGDLASYEPAHRRIGQLPRVMAAGLLLLDRSPMLQRHVLRTFSRRPELFAGMLGIHVGHSPLHLLGRDGILGLGMRLLTT